MEGMIEISHFYIQNLQMMFLTISDVQDNSVGYEE